MKIVGLAVLAIFAIVLIQQLGDNGRSQENKPAQVVAQEDDTRAPTVTNAEQSWIDDVVQATGTLSDALHTISEITSDPTAQTLLVTGDDETVIRMGAQIAVLEQCSNIFEEAGPPPTMRLQHVLKPLLQSCLHLENAGSALANGIDKLDADLLTIAADEMNKGSTYVKRATERVNALSG